MILFIYLKIILLQYFQFPVFSFSKISSIRTDSNLLMFWKRNEIKEKGTNIVIYIYTDEKVK